MLKKLYVKEKTCLLYINIEFFYLFLYQVLKFLLILNRVRTCLCSTKMPDPLAYMIWDNGNLYNYHDFFKKHNFLVKRAR